MRKVCAMTQCHTGTFSELNTISLGIILRSNLQKYNTIKVLSYFTLSFLIIYPNTQFFFVFDAFCCFWIYVVSQDFGVNIFRIKKNIYPKIPTDSVYLATLKTIKNETGMHNWVNYDEWKSKCDKMLIE